MGLISYNLHGSKIKSAFWGIAFQITWSFTIFRHIHFLCLLLCSIDAPATIWFYHKVFHYVPVSTFSFRSCLVFFSSIFSVELNAIMVTMLLDKHNLQLFDMEQLLT